MLLKLVFYFQLCYGDKWSCDVEQAPVTSVAPPLNNEATIPSTSDRQPDIPGETSVSNGKLSEVHVSNSRNYFMGLFQLFLMP